MIGFDIAVRFQVLHLYVVITCPFVRVSSSVRLMSDLFLILLS